MNRKTNLLIVALLLLAQAKAQDVAKDADQYTLFPHEVTLAPGASVVLKVYFEPNNKTGEITEPDLIPDWRINGHVTPLPNEGSFSLQRANRITYTAPSTPPDHDPVVTAEIELPKGLDSANINKAGLKMILYCTIHVVDEPNFFSISNVQKGSKGSLYVFKEPMQQTVRQSAEWITDASGEWSVHNSGIDKNGNQLNIRLQFDGGGTGSHSWHLETKENGDVIPPVVGAAVDVIGIGGNHLSYASVKLPGSIVIKTFDTKTKLVRGYFSGEMMNAGKETVFVSGGFMAYLR